MLSTGLVNNYRLRLLFTNFTVKHFYITIIVPSIPLQHDGRERKQGWFLDEIQVTNPRKPQTWTFPCYQWLSLYESDCQVRRSLKPLIHKKAEKVGKHNALYTNMIVEELTCTCI